MFIELDSKKHIMEPVIKNVNIIFITTDLPRVVKEMKEKLCFKQIAFSDKDQRAVFQPNPYNPIYWIIEQFKSVSKYQPLRHAYECVGIEIVMDNKGVMYFHDDLLNAGDSQALEENDFDTPFHKTYFDAAGFYFAATSQSLPSLDLSLGKTKADTESPFNLNIGIHLRVSNILGTLQYYESRGFDVTRGLKILRNSVKAHLAFKYTSGLELIIEEYPNEYAYKEFLTGRSIFLRSNSNKGYERLQQIYHTSETIGDLERVRKYNQRTIALQTSLTQIELVAPENIFFE
jgi:hypothetical protein